MIIDPITHTVITAADIRRELISIQRQIEAARTEEMELIFLELKWKREQLLKEAR